MREALVKKTEIINEINEKISKTETLVVVDYTKLKVSDLQELRKELRKQDSELKIYKNNLVTFALKDSKFKDLDQHLTGQNAFVFGYKDQLAPAKISAKFAKTHPSLKLKAGIYENKVLDTKQITEIALLPTKDELYATIAMLLKQPLVKFALTIKEIGNNLEG